MLLLGLGTSVAVNTATPARRPRPNGPRYRVTRSIPCTGQAHEMIELLWGTARGNDLIVQATHPDTAGNLRCSLRCSLRPTYSGIVVGGVVATHTLPTVSPPTAPRGPPLVSHYSLI